MFGTPIGLLLFVPVFLFFLFWLVNAFFRNKFRKKFNWDYFLPILSSIIVLPAWFYRILISFSFESASANVHSQMFSMVMINILVIVVFSALCTPLLAIIEGLKIAYFVLSAGTLFDLDKRRTIGKEYKRIYLDLVALTLLILTFLNLKWLGIDDLFKALGSL